MVDFDAYFATLCTILCDQGVQAALDLLGLSGNARPRTVHLIEGDSTLAEALEYARALFEFGRDNIAAEIVMEVIRTGITPANQPLSGQIAVA